MYQFQQQFFIFLLFIIYSTTAKKDKNCYQKFGISTQANARQIKKAFRKLALKYHPDKASNPAEAEKHEEIFKELAHCYEILSDDNQRSMYDANGYRESNGNSHHFGNEHFSDIFSRFFGEGNTHGFHFGTGFDSGSSNFFYSSDSNSYENDYDNYDGRQRMHQQRSKPKKIKKIYLDLEDIIKDSQRSVNIQSCHMNRRGKRKCNKKTVTFNIPKGCPNGRKINGNEYDFKIYTNQHSIFERARSDLYMNYNITVEQALLGFDLDIITIDDEQLNIYISEIPVNSQYTIRRKGLPRFKSKNDENRGHLIVKFQVLYPVLNEEQKKLFKTVLINNDWNYEKAVRYQKKEQKKKQRRKKSYKKDL